MNHVRRSMLTVGVLVAACGGAAATPTITQRAIVAVPTSTTDQNAQAFAISGMSGITYRGGNEFVVVMDNSDKLVRLGITFNADASIATLAVTAGITIAINSDHEGLAFTDGLTNTVLVTSEVGPDISEFNLATGNLVRTLSVPTVYTAPGNLRSNFGFESLARRGNTGELWTANEEALVPDGAQSSQASGTTVRILHYTAGNPPAPAQQYAYVTQPWHGSAITGARSGVSDMVALPSGKLLMLERSLALSGSGLYKNSIYLVNFTGATDVSGLPGLIGQVYTPVSKTLLWSAFLNQNLEGLGLGPRLANGHWVLVGVIDAASGDPVSTNSAISFELDDPPFCLADYNGSGTISVQDLFSFLTGWFSLNPLADVNRSGTVTVQDIFTFLGAWFGGVCP